MNDKLKPTVEEIAHSLRRMLYGKAKPSDNDYAQCRTMQVSYPDFAKICGYERWQDIPENENENLYESVYLEAYENFHLIVGFGQHTILVGGDFQCDVSYIDSGARSS